jgi:hypothetical protein
MEGAPGIVGRRVLVIFFSDSLNAIMMGRPITMVPDNVKALFTRSTEASSTYATLSIETMSTSGRATQPTMTYPLDRRVIRSVTTRASRTEPLPSFSWKNIPTSREVRAAASWETKMDRVSESTSCSRASASSLLGGGTSETRRPYAGEPRASLGGDALLIGLATMSRGR